MKTPQLKYILPVLAVSILSLTAPSYGDGIDTTDPSLPPQGDYLSPELVHATYSGPGLTAILSQAHHSDFANITIIPRGPDEEENFDSFMFGMVSVNGGPAQGVSGQGPVRTLVLGKTGNVTGTFQTEMLALDLAGFSPFGPFMIRESPTLPSLGVTSITDIGGGMYHIDSFFDIFTELSIDGGASWMPDTTGPTHMVLNPSPIPEPTSVSLLGIGLVSLAGFVRRRR